MHDEAEWHPRTALSPSFQCLNAEIAAPFGRSARPLLHFCGGDSLCSIVLFPVIAAPLDRDAELADMAAALEGALGRTEAASGDPIEHGFTSCARSGKARALRSWRLSGGGRILFSYACKTAPPVLEHTTEQIFVSYDTERALAARHTNGNETP